MGIVMDFVKICVYYDFVLIFCYVVYCVIMWVQNEIIVEGIEFEWCFVDLMMVVFWDCGDLFNDEVCELVCEIVLSLGVDIEMFDFWFDLRLVFEIVFVISNFVDEVCWCMVVFDIFFEYKILCLIL